MKQTNLEEVKGVAKMFLYMDIGETAYSPIIIKRYGQEGTVYEAQINKEHIYALF